MSNIWNPHAFGVTGQPVGPQVNTLRVYGAEPSKEQLAMAQQAFAKFCMTERLSAVPNQTQQGFLPDGSKYRIVVVNGTRIMEVRPVGSDELENGPGQEMAHGLLRDYTVVDADLFNSAAWKEFKEKGSGVYVNTRKLLYLKKPDEVRRGIVGTMTDSSSTGLTKKFHQFVRGASSAYSKYFDEQYGLPINRMFLGSGIVAFGNAGDRRAYIYTYYGSGNVMAMPVKIMPAGRIIQGGQIPSEMAAMFGGCPIPPSDTEWSSKAYVALTSAGIDSAIGFTKGGTSTGFSINGLLGPAGGTSFSLPYVVTSDDGMNLYFVASKYDFVSEFKPVTTRPVRLTFSETTIGSEFFLRATATAIGYEGISDYTPPGDKRHRPGITKGICAVGLFQGLPTFFEVKREAHTWDSGAGEVTDTFKVTVNITGGINEVCVVQDESIFLATNEIGTCSASYVVSGDTATYTASVVQRIRTQGGSTKIITGSDGTIQITKAHMDSRISYEANAGVTVVFESPPGTYDPSNSYVASTSGSIITTNPGAPPPHHKYIWDMNPSNFFFEYSYPSMAEYYPIDEDAWVRQVFSGFVPAPIESSTYSGSVVFGLQKVVYDSTTIYAGDTQYTIDAEAVLEQFETATRVAEIRESRAFMYVDPLYLVRPKSYEDEIVRPAVKYVFSHMGQENVISHYRAFNWNTAEPKDREMNYGPLGSGDQNCTNMSAYFVGKT